MPLALALLLLPLAVAFELGAGAARKPRPGNEVISKELFVLPDTADVEAKLSKLEKSEGTTPDVQCWQAVKAELISICVRSNLEQKQRVALAAAACFMHHSGREDVPTCSKDTPHPVCMKEIEKRYPDSFAVYSEWFNHLDSICFYVRREAFQEDTERAVHGLYSVTLETSGHLSAFARAAEHARGEVLSALSDQQTAFNTYMDSLEHKQTEHFSLLSDTASKLHTKQDEMVSSLEHKSQSLQSALDHSVTIQQQVKSTQAGLLEQFGKANKTLTRLENRQEDALALVQTTTDDLRRLSETQHAAFSQTSSALSSLQEKQEIIGEGITRATQAANKFNEEQAKLFHVLFTQANQIKSGQENLLSAVSNTRSSLDDLSAQQKVAFEGSVSRLEQIEKSTVNHAHEINSRLLESKQTQELAFRVANDGFALMSTTQQQVNEKQQQLLLTLMGTHDRLGKMQEQSENSYKEASKHLSNIQEQSQLAEERVHKAMQGLQGHIEDNFRRLVSLDYSILTELFMIKSFVFYACCAVVAFFCTSSRQTQRVRPHLFALLLLSCYLEGQVSQLLGWLPQDAVVLIIRKVLVASVCGLLVVSVWKFRDYHELGYTLALENQDILRSVVLHLQKRAVADNFFDTSDLDRLSAFRGTLKIEKSAPLKSPGVKKEEKKPEEVKEDPQPEPSAAPSPALVLQKTQPALLREAQKEGEDSRKEGEPEAPSETQPEGASQRCVARLKKGGQCSRKATTNSKCSMHKDSEN